MASPKRIAADNEVKGGASAPSTGGEKSAPQLDTLTGYLLRRAHYVYYTYWLEHFRGGDEAITPMQSGVLIMLARNPRITQSVLARMMGIKAPTAFKLILGLENKGYVERYRSSNDKRAQLIGLTAAGARILETITQVARLRDEQLMAGFTAAERMLLSEMLSRIIIQGNDHLGISQEIVSSQLLGARKENDREPAREVHPSRPDDGAGGAPVSAEAERANSKKRAKRLKVIVNGSKDTPGRKWYARARQRQVSRRRP